MPDHSRKTISATQMPALFNASPYLTKWMLYRYLKGDDIEPAETSRMDWGKRLQPLVLEQTGRDLNLEIEVNFYNTYIKATFAPIGYTGDAMIFDPSRGPGAAESKCVFDYGVWMREWDGGKAPPKHIELQLQQQMAVGDGNASFTWGVIPVWVCGEMVYFHRTLDTRVRDLIAGAARGMFDAVEAGEEPTPFGSELEAPLLQALFPTVKGRTLDLTGHGHGQKWADLAAAFVAYGDEAHFYDKAREAVKAQLLALVQDYETVELPGGVTLKASTRNVKEHVRAASSSTIIKVVRAQAEASEPTAEWTP
jgi:hypothetical protein